jgi:hypothetical protein
LPLLPVLPPVAPEVPLLPPVSPEGLGLEVPPAALSLLGAALPELPLAADGSLPALLASFALVLLDELVVVEEVLACAEASSAEVLVGGVISGVLCGTASETVLLPQALNARPQRRTIVTPRAARCAGREATLTRPAVLTRSAAPCVGHRLGSR